MFSCFVLLENICFHFFFLFLESFFFLALFSWKISVSIFFPFPGKVFFFLVWFVTPFMNLRGDSLRKVCFLTRENLGNRGFFFLFDYYFVEFFFWKTPSEVGSQSLSLCLLCDLFFYVFHLIADCLCTVSCGFVTNFMSALRL